MTKIFIIFHFATRFDLTRKKAAAILEEIPVLPVSEVKKAGSVSIPGIGKLVVSKRKARMGRNPATREAIKISAKKVAKMRLAKAAKESIVALTEEKSGRKVILTPKSGDLGVNVLSFNGPEVFLIQCKHSVWGSSCDDDVIIEMINSFDNYRARWAKELSYVSLCPVLITNGKLTGSAIRLAKDRDVKYMDSKSLMQVIGEMPCSLAEIELMETRRKGSMREVDSELRPFLRKASN